MSVKMSSEGDSTVNLDSEKSEKQENDTTNSESSTPEKKAAESISDKKNSDAKQESSEEVDSKPKDNDKVKSNEKTEKDSEKTKSGESSPVKKEEAAAKKEKPLTNDKAPKKEKDEKEKIEKTSNKNAKKSEDDEDDEDENEDEEDEEDDEDEEEEKKEKPKSKPLLDQPLEKSGKRDRKSTQRFDEEFASEQKESVKVDIPPGPGTALGNIPRIDASISRFKNDDMKLLHRILFKSPGKSTMVKRNIKKFNGFDFDKDSDEYQKKLQTVQNCELKQLKSICEMLDLAKTGTKEEISDKILEFLMEPKDSGKAVGGGRPKRASAVRANNRGYTSHDNYSSDEHPSRSSRNKGGRANLKDDSSSHSDEDFEPSDGASDANEKPRLISKRKRNEKKKKPKDSDDDVSDDIESPSSEEDSDFGEDKRKKPVKPANNKAKGGKGIGRRGRPPAASATSAKKPPNKAAGKKKKESSDEEESDKGKDDGSSSEDEPLAKKAKGEKPQPPTDDEIKSYVKEILKDANLEEITMKTVCQQVYGHYPDFDLTHKKDFIKTTVKSLIST